MRNQIRYEWDYETWDDNNDIIDHYHADKLADFKPDDVTAHLCLIRDAGNEINGMEERTWAYVKDGQLPEYFSDAFGALVHLVPKRFHKELATYLKK